MPLSDNHPDLIRGQEAEEQFLASYSPFIERANSTTTKEANWAAPDFRVIGSGDFVELKADSYPTPKNFFFERLSSKKSKKSGGPWRCQEEGVRFLAYWFVNEGHWYLFEVDDLVERLESLDLKKHHKEVPNRGYITTGYAVPIRLVEDLVTKHELEFKH